MSEEYTGGSSNYYSVWIENPTTEDRPKYFAECNDIIEALDMTYAEANVFKATWRKAAERTLGLKKKGNNAVYDSEKMVFFSNRTLIQEKHKAKYSNGINVKQAAEDAKEVITRMGGRTVFPTAQEAGDNLVESFRKLGGSIKPQPKFEAGSRRK